MKMKKFVIAAAASFLLAGCGATTSSTSSSSKSSTPSSSSEEISFSQNTESISETMYNLQIVGDMSEGEPTWPSWTPTATTTAGDIGSQVHFVRESKMVWKLLNVTLGQGTTEAGHEADQFKFTFDDKWSNDFGWEGLDQTTFAKEYFVCADAGAEKGNIKVIKSGTFDFEYHPFYVAEEGIGNKIVAKLHTA